jgi:hypothetical protein
MKLRILPLALTAVLTATVLFGGYFAYRHYGVEQPLDRVANGIPGVQSATVDMTAGQVKVNVDLAPNADLGAVYREVKKDGATMIGGRQLELAANSKNSPTLDKAWSYALFDVAEAMDTRKYSGIRDKLELLSQKFPGMTVKTEMDADNVYISLRDGDAAKYVVLPREPASIGAWPNA